MGVLMASKCDCGRLLLPPTEWCVHCGSTTRPVTMDNEGVILSYTTLHYPPEGFEPPLVLALVELEDEEGARTKVMCSGKILEDGLSIGMKVNVEKSGERFVFGR